MFSYTTRPIEDRTWLRPAHKRGRSPYKAGWSATSDLLGRELRHLKARNVVLQVDCTEQQLRLDGQLRAGARLGSDAVVLAFDSVHGAVSWRSDAYDRAGYSSPSGTQGWHHNLRAIGLTLEALRAVDRHGVSESGEQYTGFRALPAGRAMPASHMTRDQALELLGKWGRLRYDLPAIPAEHVNTDPESLRGLHRAARRAAHPDRNNGDQTVWNLVEQAARVLGVDR